MSTLGLIQRWCLLAALVIAPAGCELQPDTPSRIVLGQGMGVLNAPVFVTNARDFWANQDLRVDVRPFVAGRLALDSLIAGDIDVATIGDTPIVYGLFKHPDLRIIATVMESNRDAKVIARRDAGISEPAHLKGKRIGVFFGTAGEYFAVRFLEANGLTREDVRLINVKAPDMVAALSNGSLDAFVSWEPHISNGKRTLGNDAIVFVDTTIYTETWNLVITEQLFQQRPDAVRQLLKAVIQGVEYTRNHSDESIAITSKALGIPADILQEIWGDYDFDVTLSEELAQTLRRQAHWILESSGASGRQSFPDVSDAILQRPLRELLPAAVTVQ